MDIAIPDGAICERTTTKGRSGEKKAEFAKHCLSAHTSKYGLTAEERKP